MGMRLLTAFCILVTGASLLLGGCTGKDEKMQGTSVDFTVVSDEEVPEELQPEADTPAVGQAVPELQDGFWVSVTRSLRM